MTRLEPAGEPSMEEILASIRRIIAEDPPGSRPAADTAPAAAPAARANDPIRESAPAAPARSGVPASAAEDFAAMSGEGSAQNDRAFARRVTGGMPASGPLPGLGDMEPQVSESSASAGAPRAAAFDIDAQLADVLEAARAAQKSQWPAPVPEADVPAHAAPPPSAVSVQAAIDSILASPRQAAAGDPLPPPAANSQNKTGFTVARDGYVSGMMPPEGNTSSRPAEPDPFEFMLGPSPFARQSAASALDGPARAAPFDDLGTLVPTRHATEPTPGAQPAFGSLQANPASGAAGPRAAEPDFSRMSANAAAQETARAAEAAKAAEEAAARAAEALRVAKAAEEAAAAARAAEEARAAKAADEERAAKAAEEARAAKAAEEAAAAERAAEEARAAKAADEAAAARAAEEAAAAERAAEEARAAKAAEEEAAALAAAEARAAQAAEEEAQAAREAEVARQAEEAQRSAAARQLHEQFASELEEMGEERSIPGGPHGSFASSALTLRADSGPHAAHDLAEAGSGGLPVARTMEDTVAELLRPMLKNWLAENMPKIVERALRKELDDSSRSEHKPAAE